MPIPLTARQGIGWLLAALWFSAGANAQPEAAEDTKLGRLSMEFVRTGELESLASLYAVLNDPARSSEYGIAIRQIAAHGRSDRSTKVLLEFVKSKIPDGLDRLTAVQCWVAKMDVFMFLSLTGGKRARKAMHDVFMDEFEYLVKDWMPTVERLEAPAQAYEWKNSLRTRAAIGLLVSGNQPDEDLVCQFFQDLHDLGPRMNVVESDLYEKLAEALVIADMANDPGSRGILYVGGGVCAPYTSEVIDAYMTEGRRPDGPLSAITE